MAGDVWARVLVVTCWCQRRTGHGQLSQATLQTPIKSATWFLNKEAVYWNIEYGAQ